MPKALYGAQKKPHAAFAAMMKRIDGYVGDIVKALDECGELDNTLIFVTSDNGAHCEGGHDPKYWNSNAGLRGLKRDLYEGGIRVPMIVYWKDRLKNSETDHISAFWDIMPTKRKFQAQSLNRQQTAFLCAAFSRKPQPKHDFLYWEFHEQGGNRRFCAGLEAA
ncbi:MAG: sulfatase-like hydrolase/transferase [Bacilli bacterium]